ncbi:MAG: hypothetical protein EA364_00255 [Balneolaceae bacterium]|nr:MAG: hypothetical protein EA364_00255 [Balneolaceae bacterium]
MKTIKTYHQRFWMAALLAAFVFTACDTVNTSQDNLTEEDIQAIQTIIGDAISDQGEGFMSEMYDLTSDISQGGMARTLAEGDGDIATTETRPRIGPNSQYQASYNAETGWHQVAFRRYYEGELFEKYMAALLRYRFSTEQGRFLEWPRRHQEFIHKVEFEGRREGFHKGPFRSSEYLRRGNWTLEGFNTDVMTLAGRQNNNGTMSAVLREGGTAEREFDLRFEVVDVTITKPNEENGLLEHYVTGNINYWITITQTRNGESRVVENRGTVELNGDGSALLRLMGLKRVVKIDLSTGRVDETPSR